ncbi:hypothetical protein [Rhizobacter sp. OV335]|nr:hypothetical protein [Rhizobacter sp. OV335]
MNASTAWVSPAAAESSVGVPGAVTLDDEPLPPHAASISSGPTCIRDRMS